MTQQPQADRRQNDPQADSTGRSDGQAGEQPGPSDYRPPPLVCLGPWVALMVLVALAVDAVCHDRLLSVDEKQQIAEGWLQYRERFRVLRLASRSAG